VTALTLYRASQVFPVIAAPLADGAVVVEHGRILAVGAAAALGERYPSARVVDLGARALLPAAVNAHTHLELSGLSGAIPAGTPFAELGDGASARPPPPDVRGLCARGGGWHRAAAGERHRGGGRDSAPLARAPARSSRVACAASCTSSCWGWTRHRRSRCWSMASARSPPGRQSFAGAPVRFGLSLHTPYNRLRGAVPAGERLVRGGGRPALHPCRRVARRDTVAARRDWTRRGRAVHRRRLAD